MALYKKHGTNPFSACLPMLIQMPFFFALFQSCPAPAPRRPGRGHRRPDPEQVAQFDDAIIFGAPLSVDLPAAPWGQPDVAVVVVSSIVMILP